MRSTGSSRQIATTTGNVVGYLASRGRHIPLEGRFRANRYQNWSRVLEHTAGRRSGDRTPSRRSSTPSGPPGRCGRSAAGHSFNQAFAGRTMVSLDRYTGVDVDTTTMTAP